MTGLAAPKAKSSLEASLTRVLARFFRDVLAHWADMRTRGMVVSLAPFERPLAALLQAHYLRIVQKFHPASVDLAGLGLAGVDSATGQRLADKSYAQARLILGTLERELAAAEYQARADLKSAGGVEVKATSVLPKGAKRWSVVLVSSLKSVARKLGTRLSVISNANTQDIAEAARSGAIDVVPPGQVQGVVVKVWNSLLDGRERAAHGAAHGQQVGVGEAFEVGGEKLRFPGDTGLGASLGNVINCRCWADYYMVKPNGDRVPLGVETPKVPARRTRKPGDVPGVTVPGLPTSAVTFPTGRTRASILLGDGKPAKFIARDGAISVIRDGRLIASAPVRIGPDGYRVLGTVQIDDAARGLGIDTLFSRSVAETNRIGRAR